MSEWTAIAGFGSLLSEASARGSFPSLRKFRFGRVYGWRRCFTHPASIFFERGIANFSSREIASLSVEPHENGSLLVSTFEIPTSEVASAFTAREEEFRFVEVNVEPTTVGDAPTRALMCARGTDALVIERWGEEWFRSKYVARGITTIWDWPGEILPCRVYLRHCVLAARKAGPVVESSFLDGTFLWDRITTVREYLASNPDIMKAVPPPSVAERYSG